MEPSGGTVLLTLQLEFLWSSCGRLMTLALTWTAVGSYPGATDSFQKTSHWSLAARMRALISSILRTILAAALRRAKFGTRLIILSALQSRSCLFLSCWPECSCTLHQTCKMLFFILKFTLQYSHVETFCSAPPAASALASVTASVMSKLIANNLLPQVRDQTHKFGALNSQTSEPLSPIQSTTKLKLCCKKYY